MTEGERIWPDDRRGEQQGPSRPTEDTGMAAWLRRTLAPRPRQIWVMEPDGRVRRVNVEC